MYSGRLDNWRHNVESTIKNVSVSKLRFNLEGSLNYKQQHPLLVRVSERYHRTSSACDKKDSLE